MSAPEEMSKQIDDQDDSVIYSKPSSETQWSTYSGTNEYSGTTSLTRIQGANAKIKFSGDSTYFICVRASLLI